MRLFGAALVWLLSANSCSGFHNGLFRIQQRSTFAPKVVAASTTIDSSSYFTIDITNDGPADGVVHTLTIHTLPGQEQQTTEIDEPNGINGTIENSNQTTSKVVAEPPIIIQTGKIGRQAAGAVTLSRGDTVLYATAARDGQPKEDLDFLPLSVEHQERFSSAGTTSGAYNKRDGRPAEHEVLTCRLIDRPLRPLIAKGWRHETQLLSWVLSYDGIRSCDPLAITASATALFLSDVPLTKPVAAVMVGYIKEQDKLILNPTHEQMEESDLQLIVAGTKDAVLMIEGAANFLPEETMIRAVTFGHDAIKVLCEAIDELGKNLGVTKNFDTIKPPVEGLQERVDQLMTERVDAMYAMGGTKITQGPVKKELQNWLLEELEEEFPEERTAILNAFKSLLCKRMFALAKSKGIRTDGRSLEEIRHLDMEVGFLPRVHGSALFTRGETQVLATATLGGSGMRQKIDKLDGTEEKRFYLQYNFPPSCVGETGRVGMPGRREVGHGNLAERALSPTLPKDDDFPYTIRVESLVTESHGSSSMASVCGGCLALMDSGVPIKNAVAGIAMGMLLDEKATLSGEDSVILSDISGTEDALGTMDFKVAGDRNGITTFQLDIKCEGLTLETMKRALEQARTGRIHILDEMEKILGTAREELPSTIPKMSTFSIAFESIGKVIGPGGKQIRAIIEDFELETMDVEDDGTIQISSFKTKKLQEAEEFVKTLVGGGASTGGKNGGKGKSERPKYEGPDPVEGEVYKGKVTGIHPFGVFVEILPGAEDGSTPGLEGLCHVSELARDRVRNCEGFMKSLGSDELEVVYAGVGANGKIKLSRKAALEAKYGKGKSQGGKSAAPPPSKMAKDELDVIAKAIKGVQE